MRNRIAIILLAALLAVLPVARAGAAMAIVQKAAEASLKCGCTVRLKEGNHKVVVKSVSKSWQKDGKNCRTLRITVFEGRTLSMTASKKSASPRVCLEKTVYLVDVAATN